MKEACPVRVITVEGANGIAEIRDHDEGKYLYFPDGDQTKMLNQPRIAVAFGEGTEWDEEKHAFRLTGKADVELVIELNPQHK